MSNFTFPSSDLDRSQSLLALFGSHWTNVYRGQYLVERYAFARGQEEKQSFLDLQEAVNALSRLEVPVFHTDNWHLYTIKASERNSSLLKYGDGAVYGNQPATGTLYKYGVAQGGGPTSSFPAPENLANAPLIFNRITEPTATLVQGVDYVRQDGQIVFRSNPFTDDNGRYNPRTVYEGADPVDEEIDLWVFHGSYDKDYIWTHYGHVIGLDLESSEDYKRLVNAIFGALVEGTTAAHMEDAISAMTGVPTAKENNEVVELVTEDNNHLVIVTDKHTYLFNKDVEAVVAVGDKLAAGDQLVDTVAFFNLNSGQIPDGVTAISVGKEFLPGGYVDGITFRDQSVPLTVTTEDGRTRVEFDVSGFPGDVETFWDTVHAQGVEDGTTLANLLDVRGSDPPSETTAASLPATVNPLEFLLKNVLRFNAFLVRIKVAGINGGTGLNVAKILRRIIPPWTAIIILYELSTEDEYSGEDVDEDQENFLGGEPRTDSVTAPDNTAEIVHLRYVDGFCT